MNSAISIIFTVALVALQFSPNLGYSRPPVSDTNGIFSSKLRLPRSANPEPQGSFGASLQGNSIDLNYLHNIFDNNRGSLSASANAQRLPGQGWTSNVGLEGTYHFPQPNHPGSITATWQKSFHGPERRPSFGLGYEQSIFSNKHGSIGISAGVQKSPGQKWQSNVGIEGRFRFRRSNEPEIEEEISQ